MPDLTTLIIQDLVLVLGSGAGGHTTLGWVTGVYLSTVAATILLLLRMDQYDLRCIQNYLFHIVNYLTMAIHNNTYKRDHSKFNF